MQQSSRYFMTSNRALNQIYAIFIRRNISWKHLCKNVHLYKYLINRHIHTD